MFTKPPISSIMVYNNVHYGRFHLNGACEHCESLNIASLLSGDEAKNSKSVSEKYIRYYCHAPNSSQLICPYSGNDKECPKIADMNS